MSILKKFIDEYYNFYGYDANLAGGYGTLNQRMKPKEVPYSLFPYVEKPEEIEDIVDDEKQKEKFSSKVGLEREPLEKDISSKEKRHFIDGATHGISDSVLRNYINLFLEDVFHNMSFRSSTAPDYVTNQFGQKVLDGTIAGWSHPNHLPDEGDEPIFDLDDLVDKHFDEEKM